MMFLRSVCSVFSGVSSFPEFSGRNPLRAIFHLLLFCLIASLICGGIETRFAGQKMAPCIAELERTFGSITVSQAGILPAKDAATPRTFYLPGRIRLDYLTKDAVPILREMGDWEQICGVIWIPDGFLLWMRPESAGDQFYLTQLPLPSLTAAIKARPGSVPIQYLYPVGADRIEKTVRNTFSRRVPEAAGKETRPAPAEDFSFSGVGEKIRLYLYTANVFSFLFGYFFLSLIVILMFSGMQALWKAPGLEKFGFSKTFSMLCYAAYPAVSAGMLLKSFSFYNSSEIVFFILFFISQLLAFNEIRRVSGGGTAG